MQISGTRSNLKNQTTTSFDANATSTTDGLEMGEAKNASLYVIARSGTNATHVITIQVSPDGSNWFDTPHTVTGLGNLHDLICIADQIRAKVTTVEGGSSLVDVTVIIK